MEKASRALRRSSVRLKALGSGYGDLRMIISQLCDVRSCVKALAKVQATASEDFMKWAVKNENQAIQDAMTQLFELSVMWTEVQKEFTGHLKEFIHQFELILEGELHVDVARNHLVAIEQRQQKLEKELTKVAGRQASEQCIQNLQRKLNEEKQAKQVAQHEVVTCVQENEAVKMARVKRSLVKLSESYIELAQKCHVLFEAHREVALQIPDAPHTNIHVIQYEGSAVTRQAVSRARERLQQMSACAFYPCAPVLDEPPPPYSATQSPSSQAS